MAEVRTTRARQMVEVFPTKWDFRGDPTDFTSCGTIYTRSQVHHRGNKWFVEYDIVETNIVYAELKLGE